MCACVLVWVLIFLKPADVIARPATPVPVAPLLPLAAIPLPDGMLAPLAVHPVGGGPGGAPGGVPHAVVWLDGSACLRGM